MLADVWQSGGMSKSAFQLVMHTHFLGAVIATINLRLTRLRWNERYGARNAVFSSWFEPGRDVAPSPAWARQAVKAVCTTVARWPEPNFVMTTWLSGNSPAGDESRPMGLGEGLWDRPAYCVGEQNAEAVLIKRHCWGLQFDLAALFYRAQSSSCRFGYWPACWSAASGGVSQGIGPYREQE